MSGLQFHVQALNVSIDASAALLSPADDVSFNAHVTANFDVPASVVQSLFRFQTDAIDITDASATDIKYAMSYETTLDVVDGAPVPLSVDWINNTLCTAGDSTFVAGTSGAIETAVPFEYMRYLAQRLFNTHLGVDLFNNEEDVRSNLNLASRTALDAKLLELTALNYVDIDNIDLSGNNHPSYIMLSKIIQSAPTRLVDLSANIIPANSAENAESFDVFKMPLLAGDSIIFKLTVNADSQQAAVVDPTGSEGVTVPERTYKIVMTVV